MVASQVDTSASTDHHLGGRKFKLERVLYLNLKQIESRRHHAMSPTCTVD